MKRLLGYLVVTLSLAAFIVLAQVKLNSFEAGEVISSDAVNENFQNLAAAIEAGEMSPYTAGEGLDLDGQSFSVAVPFRLPQACANGDIPEWTGSAWACGTDDVGEGGGGGDITGVKAGSGLEGGGTSGNVTLSADTNVIQTRVSGKCAEGHAVRSVGIDGKVVCVTVGSGDIEGVKAGAGLVGGGASGEVTLNVDAAKTQARVAETCPEGQAIREIKQDGTVTCEVDDSGTGGTTYTAGAGLQLDGNQFGVAFAGDGEADTVARSDHNHLGETWEGEFIPDEFSPTIRFEDGFLSISSPYRTAQFFSKFGPSLELISEGTAGRYALLVNDINSINADDIVMSVGARGKVAIGNGGTADAGLTVNHEDGVVYSNGIEVRGYLDDASGLIIDGDNSSNTTNDAIRVTGKDDRVYRVTNEADVFANSFNTTSDRNAKTDFADLDAREILEQVAHLPIQTWRFKGDAVRHVGPTAQDFYAAFETGASDKTITTVDADGVALAAIQGLYEMLQEKDAELEALRAQVEALQRKLE